MPIEFPAGSGAVVYTDGKDRPETIAINHGVDKTIDAISQRWQVVDSSLCQALVKGGENIWSTDTATGMISVKQADKCGANCRHIICHFVSCLLLIMAAPVRGILLGMKHRWTENSSSPLVPTNKNVSRWLSHCPVRRECKFSAASLWLKANPPNSDGVWTVGDNLATHWVFS